MQQQQQGGPMFSVMPSFPPTNITAEQIQKYLDENKKLILAILDNQNLGKLAECAQYQAQLQKNLMYLAAIADAQPQTQTMPQMAPHPGMQQGGFYMQHPQAAGMGQQPGVFPQKMPLQFGSPHQMQGQQQQLYQQQQQAIQGQIGMRSAGAVSGMHPTQNEVTLGGGISGPPAHLAGNDKQNAPEAGVSSGADGQGSSVVGHGGGGESSYIKGQEEAK